MNVHSMNRNFEGYIYYPQNQLRLSLPVCRLILVTKSYNLIIATLIPFSFDMGLKEATFSAGAIFQ